MKSVDQMLSSAKATATTKQRRIYIVRTKDGSFRLIWGGVFIRLSRAELVGLVSEAEQELRKE